MRRYESFGLEPIPSSAELDAAIRRAHALRARYIAGLLSSALQAIRAGFKRLHGSRTQRPEANTAKAS